MNYFECTSGSNSCTSNSIVILSLCIPFSHSVQGLDVGGDSESPLIHLRLQQPTGSREKDQELLQSIVSECHANQVAVVTAKYLEQEEHYLPQPR